MRVDNAVWLPKHFAVESRARILFFFKYQMEDDETYFNYRKLGPLQTSAALEEQVVAATRRFVTLDLP